MKFSALKESCLLQFDTPNGNRVVPFIIGAPGGGKSSLAREIADELAKKHDIPEDRIVEFNPSLREPTDILGLPIMGGECSKWLPPAELYALRAGQGPCILIIEELSDATMDMQNPLCRVILDRYAGQMKLSDELYIIATGNRTSDRSGANRMSTKLANRMRILEFTEDLDDWIKWAEGHGIHPVMRAFLKWRPNLLSDFDPSNSSNPTPRSWEDVSRIPLDMPDDSFFEHVAGSVGKGAASEYCGFIRIYKDLPDFNEIMKHPDTAEVPTSPDVLFAITAKIATVVNKSNFSKLYKFIERLPPEFVVKTMKECMKECDSITRTAEFRSFAIKNVDVLTGV